MTRQYVAVQFEDKPGARRYTYHNDGPPVAVGDVVEVWKGDKPIRVQVAALPQSKPNFETQPILQPPSDVVPGEDTATAHGQEKPAAIGHNRPESPVDEAAVSDFELKVRDHADAAGAWLDKGEIADDDAAGKVADLLNECQTLAKQIDEKRTEDKRPFLEAGREVDARYGALLDPLKLSIEKVKKLLTGYASRKKAAAEVARRAEAERLRREEEEARAKREAAEAKNDAWGQSEAEAAAEEARKSREKLERQQASAKIESATGGGRARGLRTKRVARVENIRRAFMGLVDEHAAEIAECLEKIANAKLRASKGGEVALPGFRIDTEESI